MRTSVFIIPFFALLPFAAFAQDKDDELKPDDTEHIEKSTLSNEQSTQIEQQNPEVAAEIRQFLKSHVEHANAKDIDVYLNDFFMDRQRRPDLLREYSERAMALKDLAIQQKAIEFAQLSNDAATVHTRQISTYTNDKGEHIVDDVVLSYRLIRNVEGAWKILLTERRRLSAQ